MGSSVKTTKNKTPSTPSYLKPTYSSLAKRVSNGTEPLSEENLALFRSYSRWNTSTFSSALNLNKKKTRSTSVQPKNSKGTKNSHTLQRKSVVNQREEDKTTTTKLRGGLKARSRSTKNSSAAAAVAVVTNEPRRRRITRTQSNAPSTADSALSVPPSTATKRSRVKNQQNSVSAQLETCLSSSVNSDRLPVHQSPPPPPPVKKQAEKKPRKKSSRISHKALVQVISRLEQQNKPVMDLYDIAILLNKRNGASKSPLKATDMEKPNKPSEANSSTLKGVIAYTRELSSWVCSEVAGSKPVRVVVAWAVLNLAIYSPSWLKPLLCCAGEGGLASLLANSGIFPTESSLKCAASIPADLMRSALVLLAAI
eukprot:g3659.t1